MRVGRRELQKVRHTAFRHAERLGARSLTGVSTDSRGVQPGDLFFALRGPQFDGHRFITDAVARGAVAAVVDADGLAGLPEDLPLLVVPDTTRALGELAAIHRSRFAIPVIAVGGSNGKTTTKDMIAAVLSTRYRTLSTEGNQNNHIGVPLTLLRLERSHDMAVVEAGTNHPGEMAYLSHIMQATHGLITNIGSEHLEFFGSLDGVADEECTLWSDAGMVAMYHADDPLLRRRAIRMKKRIGFGFRSQAAAVRGSALRTNDAGCAGFRFRGGRMRVPHAVQLQIPGRHHAVNALASAAVGLAFRIPPASIREALEHFTPSDKRMEVLSLGGVTVVNDTYNANADSTIAALQTLADLRITGKRVAVLADMLELGPHAGTEHHRVGEAVSAAGIDYLLAFGPLSASTVKGAKGVTAFHYDQKNILAEYLFELLGPGDAVLVKGSRGMKMEDIVTFLQHRLARKPPTGT